MKVKQKQHNGNKEGFIFTNTFIIFGFAFITISNRYNHTPLALRTRSVMGKLHDLALGCALVD